MNQNVLFLFNMIPHLRVISLFGDPLHNRKKGDGNNLPQHLLLALEKLFLEQLLSHRYNSIMLSQHVYIVYITHRLLFSLLFLE